MKKIGCLFVSIIVWLMLIEFTVILPSNAGVMNYKSDVNPISSLVAKSNSSALFDNQKVKLGITPTGWSNSDDTTIDLVPPIPYQQILSEMALSGYEGSQMSGKYPQDMATLKRELALRNFTISEPWVGTFFTINDRQDSKKIFRDQLKFMKEIGGDRLVVAELGGAVHQQPVAPLPNRPKFTDQQWEQLITGLKEIAEEADKAGMQLCYHPHVGTGVETLEDIDRLMEGTKDSPLKLLLDTGHLYYAGADPLEVTQKYRDRIGHVHLKNIRQDVLASSIKQGRSFLDSIREGAFTVPGDKAGVIEFEPILKELAQADYEGWLVVEAEQDPNKANPLEYALMARNYLRETTGL
ncbi:MAG: myo-inosose-2 dehydratase [Cyanobacteria bacterium P01_A01_bin.83]